MHEKFEQIVDVLIARGLPESESREAREHAGACAPCGTLLHDAETFASWVRGAAAPDAPPADLEDRIITRFREGSKPKRRLPTLSRGWMRAIAGVAAVIALVMLGGAFNASRGNYLDGVRAKHLARSGVEGSFNSVGFTDVDEINSLEGGRTRGFTAAREVDKLGRMQDQIREYGKKIEAPSNRPAPEAAPDAPKTGATFSLEDEKRRDEAKKDAGAEAGEKRSEAPPANPFLQDRKIIRNGTLYLEVESYEPAYKAVADIAANERGFIATADSQRLANGKMRATITLRIPPDRFEAALARLRDLGTVRHQNISSQDVSKAYVDLESRLKSKEALVERLKITLKDGKGNVKELMEVEVAMGQTIEAIEQIKGELKYYDNLVGLATITLQLAEKDLGQPFEYVQTLQSNIGLTVQDADATYAAAQKTITDAGGQVADCKMTRQSDGSIAAFVRGRVDAAKFPSVREALRRLGHVDNDTLDQQQTARGGHGAGNPNAPVKKEQAVIDVTIATPPIAVTRASTITVETAKAEDAYTSARRSVELAGGKIVGGTLQGQTDGMRATLRAEVDADKFAALVDALKALGTVKNATVEQVLPPSAKPGETRPMRERASIDLTIATPPQLIKEEHGIGRTIRDTFANSYGALMTSVEKLFVGLSLAGPWIALIAIVVLVVRRIRRKKAVSA